MGMIDIVVEKLPICGSCILSFSFLVLECSPVYEFSGSCPWIMTAKYLTSGKKNFKKKKIRSILKDIERQRFLFVDLQQLHSYLWVFSSMLESF